MKKTLFLPALAVLTLAPWILQAQFRQATTRSAVVVPRPDVLGPAPIIWRLGVNLGLNLNDHDGDFSTIDCQCLFSDGAGRGILWGAELSHPVSDAFVFAVKVLYDDKRGTYSKDTLKNTLVVDTQSGQVTSMELPYERTLDVRLAYLVVHPVVQFLPIGGLYLFAGPAAGFNLDANYEMKEKHLNGDFTYLDGNSETVIEPKSDIPSAESIRIDLRAGIGYNLKLSRDVYFSPEVSVAYPLNGITSDGDWFARALHLTGVLKFTL